MRGLERTRKFFFVLKSVVPTQSSQDKEKFSCPFQSTDNFPEWKLALYTVDAMEVLIKYCTNSFPQVGFLSSIPFNELLRTS